MTVAPGYLPERIRHLWDVLTHPVSDPARTADLPDPVRQWLDLVSPDTSVPRRGVQLQMRGEIRLGKWRQFQARQVISQRGFIWAAEVGKGLATIKGFDLYAEGTGEMDWRIGGLVPVMRQHDDDITRSGAGRFAGELLVFTPFNARSGMISWLGATSTKAVATVDTGDHSHRVSMSFDGEGRLQDLNFPRWGNPDGEGFREEPFGVVFEGEHRFGDLVLPASFTAGWWPDTDRWTEGAFFRCSIDDARTF